MYSFDYIAVLLVGAIGAGILWTCFRQARFGVSLPLVYVAMLFLYLGGGAVFTLLTAPKSYIDTLFWVYDVGPLDLVRSCLVVGLFGGSVLFLGRWSKKYLFVTREELCRFSKNVAQGRGFEAVAFAFFVVQAAAVARGRYGFEGVVLNQEIAEVGVASPLGLFAQWTSVACAPAAAFVMAARRRLSIGALLAFLWNIGLVVLGGRRNFLSVALLSTLPIFIIPYGRSVRVSILATGSVAAIAVLILFFAFRSSMRTFSLDRKEISAIASGGVELLSGSQTSGGVVEGLLENTTTRTFNMGYLSLVAKNAYPASGANGTVLWYSVVSAIPGFLYPQKYMFTLTGGEEEIAMSVLGISTSGDENNSAITAALTDFGYVGVVLYAFVALLFMAASLRLIRYCDSGVLGLIALFFLMYNLTYIEATFATLFIAFRVLAFFVGIGIVLRLFNGQKGGGLRRVF